MAKKDKKIDVAYVEARACPTCSAWGNEDPQEFPCTLAKVVVVRANPRVNCKFWRSIK